MSVIVNYELLEVALHDFITLLYALPEPRTLNFTRKQNFLLQTR